MLGKVEGKDRIREGIVGKEGRTEKLSRIADGHTDNWVLDGQQELA